MNVWKKKKKKKNPWRPIQQLCSHFLVKTTDVIIMLALKEKSGDHQSRFDSSSGDHDCLNQTLC